MGYVKSNKYESFYQVDVDLPDDRNDDDGTKSVVNYQSKNFTQTRSVSVLTTLNEESVSHEIDDENIKEDLFDLG